MIDRYREIVVDRRDIFMAESSREEKCLWRFLELQQTQGFLISSGVAVGKHSSMHETMGPNKSHKTRQQTPPL